LGNMHKLKELREKYGIKFDEIYTSTYSFMSYADYRKYPEIEEEFNMEKLSEMVEEVRKLAELTLEKLKEVEIYGKLDKYLKNRV